MAVHDADLDPAAAAELAGFARQLELRLAALGDDLDPEQAAEGLERQRCLDALPDAPRARLAARWRLADLGGTLPLAELRAPLVRLALQARAEALRSLCVLALAARPGVLRCCIDRTAREAMRSALGELFGLLAERRGRAVDADQARWSPVRWACLGFIEWQAALPPSASVYARLVRCMVPLPLLQAVGRDDDAPPELSVAQALAELQARGCRWPV